MSGTNVTAVIDGIGYLCVHAYALLLHKPRVLQGESDSWACENHCCKQDYNDTLHFGLLGLLIELCNKAVKISF